MMLKGGGWKNNLMTDQADNLLAQVCKGAFTNYGHLFGIFSTSKPSQGILT